MRAVTATILLVCLLLLPGGTAAAQSVKRVGDFADWSAYVTEENGRKVCFIASSPQSSEGNYTRRGDVYAMVTLRPEEQRGPEVSLIAGYTYQDKSSVEAEIDNRKFQLFTKADTAWLPGGQDLDKQMIDAMLPAVSMLVRGNSSRGTLTVDLYSLRGFTAAYKAMQDACK